MISEDFSSAIETIVRFNGCQPDDSGFPASSSPLRLLDALTFIAGTIVDEERKDPTFPAEYQHLLTVELLKATSIVAKKQRFFASWYSKIPNLTRIRLLCEWENEAQGLPPEETVRVCLIYIFFIFVNGPRDFSRALKEFDGFAALKSVVDSGSSLHSKMYFCYLITSGFDGTTDSAMEPKFLVKKLAEFNYLETLFTFLRHESKELREFSTFSLFLSFDGIQRRQKFQYCRSLDTAAVVRLFAETILRPDMSMTGKKNISFALITVLLLSDESRDQLIDCNGFEGLLGLLVTLTKRKEDLVEGPVEDDNPGLNEDDPDVLISFWKLKQFRGAGFGGRNPKWQVAQNLISVLGIAASGSDGRQERVGKYPKLIPTLVKVLRWFVDSRQGDNAAASLNTVCCRSIVNCQQLNGNDSSGLLLLLDFLDHSHTRSFETLKGVSDLRNAENIPESQEMLSMVLNIISRLIDFRVKKIPVKIKARLFRAYKQIVSVLAKTSLYPREFQLAPKYFTVALEFILVVTTLRVVDRNHHIAECSEVRGAHGFIAWMLKCFDLNINGLGEVADGENGDEDDEDDDYEDIEDDEDDGEGEGEAGGAATGTSAVAKAAAAADAPSSSSKAAKTKFKCISLLLGSECDAVMRLYPPDFLPRFEAWKERFIAGAKLQYDLCQVFKPVLSKAESQQCAWMISFFAQSQADIKEHKPRPAAPEIATGRATAAATGGTAAAGGAGGAASGFAGTPQPPVNQREMVVCGNPICALMNCLSKCGRCKKVAYCSVKCQQAHWKTHKPNCLPKPKK